MAPDFRAVAGAPDARGTCRTIAYEKSARPFPMEVARGRQSVADGIGAYQAILRAFWVAGPASPSATRPLSFWKFRTAWAVWGP